MKTIYKYPFELKDESCVEMPDGSRVLHVGVDLQGVMCLWAEVDTEVPKRNYSVCVRGTGHLLKGNEGVFVGTFVERVFVWHVYVS